MRPERMMELADIPRRWEYGDVLKICKAILRKDLKIEKYDHNWGGVMYKFIKTRVEEPGLELSRNQIKEMFRERISEVNEHGFEE